MKPRIAIPAPTLADHAYNEQNWPAYAEAVKASGGYPVRMPADLAATSARELADTCDGYLLPGSPADVAPGRYGQPREDATADADGAREATDSLLLELAESQGKPLLAVCFGMQMMNVWHGGTLVQDLAPVPVNHAAGRSVTIAHFAGVAPGSMLAALADLDEGSFKEARLHLPVNSSHHQAIGIPGSGLVVTSRSIEDGVVEAIEPLDKSRFLLGVQWHPERTFTISATSRAIFAAFVEAAVITQALGAFAAAANR